MPGHSDDDVTLGPTDEAIRLGAAPTTPAAARTPGTSKFAPGSIIAGRYRLVALLGKGGMGEVYRADDLTLDQAVALKFLPEGGTDAGHLAQFHNELRVARQVSHKNVCRLYDLGEAHGRRFLTMENGLLVAAIMFAVSRVLEGVPLTSALSHWAATTSNIALALVQGLMLFGFYASRAGQPLFGRLEG